MRYNRDTIEYALIREVTAMVCEKCGKNISEKSIFCTECGEPVKPENWGEISPEERARKLWLQKEKQRRKNQHSKHEIKPEEIVVSQIESPMAETIKEMVAELSADNENKPEELSEEISEEICEDTENDDIPEDKSVADNAEMPENQEFEQQSGTEENIQNEAEPEEAQSEKAEADISENVETVESDENTESAEDNISENIEPAEGSGYNEQPENDIAENSEPIKDDMSQNSEQTISMTSQREDDDFPDIHIPQIYAQAKYIPEKEKNAKWAEKAAEDEENDWEGFNPDSADWSCNDEEEHKSNIITVVIVLIILAAAVGLAVYSCATSDLFTLFG